MKIFQITNSLSGSIGMIAQNISNTLSSYNIENKILITNGKSDVTNSLNYSNPLLNKGAALKSKVTGKYGFNNAYSTNKLIRILSVEKPNLILIHNIHGHDLNISKAFAYFEENSIPIVWFFHDCWAYTGGCAYPWSCQKWKSRCYECPQFKKYSYFFDVSAQNFKQKEIIANYKCVKAIITPSNWLKDMVKQSMFCNTPTRVIANGIDTNVFDIQCNPCQLLDKYKDKKIIVTCANQLSITKGVNQYLQLAQMLDDSYQILVIGTIDKSIILPKNMTVLGPIYNKNKIASIYSNCYAFVNLTQADNLPTVNLEAQACGLPVICNDVGGCKDTIVPEISKLIPINDLNQLIQILNNLDIDLEKKQDLHYHIELNFNKVKQCSLLVDFLLTIICNE